MLSARRPDDRGAASTLNRQKALLAFGADHRLPADFEAGFSPTLAHSGRLGLKSASVRHNFCHGARQQASRIALSASCKNEDA
jgi:hypothetical protein